MPVIAVSAAPDPVSGEYRVGEAYLRAVRAAGGEPLPVPAAPAAVLPRRASGLLLPGGGDIDPFFYGGPRHPALCPPQPEADLGEFALLAQACRRGLPVLAICRGIQVVNVCFGGTLWQDLPTQLPAALCHDQTPSPRGEASHTVLPAPESCLAALTGGGALAVNSFHHQAVRRPAAGFRVSARSPDGVIEALEGKGVLAVQWHPECLPDARQARLFADLVRRAKKA